MRRLLFMVLVLGVSIGASPIALAQEDVPIDNVVVVMQEDRTFDHYFGTYPGANGWPDGASMPMDPLDPSAGSVEPFKLSETRTISLPHSAAAMLDAYNDGAMDGFVSSARAYGGGDGSLVMGYYNADAIPFYWYLADEYVLADSWFSSVMGPSFPNHLFLFGASASSPEGDRYSSVPAGGLDLLTIFDRLEEAGVSWKVYVQGYDPTANFRDPEARLGLTDKGAQLIWVPLVGIPRYVDDPVLSSKIVDLDQYFIDAKAGELPSVSFITPSGLSEHPPGDLQLGHFFATDLLEELMLSPQWETSAFFLTWDEWGGWADHVTPPQVDQDGYGMRVPALIVSPYAKRGYVDNTVYDHTSPLAFIEWRWGIEPLTERDANANNLTNAFDFSQDPREPKLPPLVYEPPSDPVPPPDTQPVRIVYATVFGGLALLALAATTSASLIGSRLPRWIRMRDPQTSEPPTNIWSLRQQAQDHPDVQVDAPVRAATTASRKVSAPSTAQPDDVSGVEDLWPSAPDPDRPITSSWPDRTSGPIQPESAPRSPKVGRRRHRRRTTSRDSLPRRIADRAREATQRRDPGLDVIPPRPAARSGLPPAVATPVPPGPSVVVPAAPRPASASRHPRPADRLQTIFGIGQATERALNECGIHTYAQLAGITPDQMQLAQSLLRSRGDLPWSVWRDEARRAIRETEPPMSPLAHAPVESGAPRDDLTRIRGIGPVTQNLLNELGITTFYALWKLDGTALVHAQRLLSMRGKIDWDEWKILARIEHEMRYGR